MVALVDRESGEVLFVQRYEFGEVFCAMYRNCISIPSTGGQTKRHYGILTFWKLNLERDLSSIVTTKIDNLSLHISTYWSSTRVAQQSLVLHGLFVCRSDSEPSPTFVFMRYMKGLALKHNYTSGEEVKSLARSWIQRQEIEKEKSHVSLTEFLFRRFESHLRSCFEFHQQAPNYCTFFLDPVQSVHPPISYLR